MVSSVSPSLKYSCSGFADKFSKGRTASITRLRSGTSGAGAETRFSSAPRYRTGETVTASADSLQKYRMPGIIFQRPPKFENGRVDTAFDIEESIGPQSSRDLLSHHQLIAPLHEQQQQLHRYSFELDRAPIPG